MAYDETPKKVIEVREGKDGYCASHDERVDGAKSAGNYGDRTDAGSQGVGYLGIDDLDKIRRRKLK